ncbi:MAG: hypothetical protein ACXVB0_14150 [Mucilaginibacter sp.]
MEPKPGTQFVLTNKGLRSLQLVYVGYALKLWLVVVLLLSINYSYSIDGVKQPEGKFNLFDASFVLFFMMIGLFIQQRRVLKKYRGFTIVVQDDVVEKSLYGFEISTLNTQDITVVSKTPRGDILVYSVNSKPLFIPRQVQKCDELEELLKGKAKSFSGGPYSFYQKYLLTMAYIVLLLVIVDFHLKNIVLIWINSGVIISAFIAEFIIRIKNWRSFEPKARRGYMVLLCGIFIWVVIALVARLL